VPGSAHQWSGATLREARHLSKFDREGARGPFVKVAVGSAVCPTRGLGRLADPRTHDKMTFFLAFGAVVPKAGNPNGTIFELGNPYRLEFR